MGDPLKYTRSPQYVRFLFRGCYYGLEESKKWQRPCLVVAFGVSCMALVCNDSHVFNGSTVFLRSELPDNCPSASEYTAAELGVGIGLTLLGACVLALSMVVQRYALAHPLDRVPFCGMTLRRGVVWACGLGLCEWRP